VVNTDGTGLHQVVAPRSGLEHPDWAPQGAGGWITFNIAPEAPDAPGSGLIMVVRPNGSGLLILRAPSVASNAHGSNLTTIISAETDHVNFPAWGSHPIVHTPVATISLT
jgi:hypothetical protein